MLNNFTFSLSCYAFENSDFKEGREKKTEQKVETNKNNSILDRN